jgi:hypothetical protein
MVGPASIEELSDRSNWTPSDVAFIKIAFDFLLK